MRSNIKDVAQKARVSIATVSRAFNESEKVRPKTRERILAIAHRMKYTPNAAARGLITRRTEAIGLLLPDLHGEFFSEVIRGADAEAQKHKYHLIVSSSHNDRSEIEAALRFMRGRVDGLVVMSPRVDADVLLSTMPGSLPVVLLNCRLGKSLYDTIVIDGFGGTKELIAHLLDGGHRRIAIIKGSANNIEADERLRGFRAAFRDRHLSLDTDLELDGDFTELSGYEAGQRILQMKNRPSAVFASNDSMAIGAIGAFHEAGLRIPQGISVCGFDDVPIAKYLRPSLTSVHVPIHDLGVMAIQRVIHRLGNRLPKQPAHILVPTTLSIRTSSKQLTPHATKKKEGKAA